MPTVLNIVAVLVIFIGIVGALVSFESIPNPGMALILALSGIILGAVLFALSEIIHLLRKIAGLPSDKGDK